MSSLSQQVVLNLALPAGTLQPLIEHVLLLITTFFCVIPYCRWVAKRFVCHGIDLRLCLIARSDNRMAQILLIRAKRVDQEQDCQT